MGAPFRGRRLLNRVDGDRAHTLLTPFVSTSGRCEGRGKTTIHYKAEARLKKQTPGHLDGAGGLLVWDTIF